MPARLRMRRRVQWLGLGIALLVAGGGCSVPIQYVRSSPSTFPPRGDPANVRLLYAEPLEPFEVLGVVSWEYYQPGLRAYEVPDILSRLQRKAWEVGGDALIVRKHIIDSAVTRNLQIVADVIRFRR